MESGRSMFMSTDGFFKGYQKARNSVMLRLSFPSKLVVSLPLHSTPYLLKTEDAFYGTDDSNVANFLHKRVNSCIYLDHHFLPRDIFARTKLY
jgi:hypothetical protein